MYGSNSMAVEAIAQAIRRSGLGSIMARKVANILQKKVSITRSRLHQALDTKVPGHIVLLIAAGGYGKTTLALDYLSERPTGYIYLPIPMVNSGVGEWFYRLRQRALDNQGDTALTLPVLTPEYAASVERFAELFTHQWLQLMPVGMPLFIDDLHRLPEQHPVQRLVVQFAEALKDAGHPVLIASRHEPPATWARLRAQNQLAFIDEAELAFTKGEQQALFKQQQIDPLERLEPLSQETDGWAAGLMLLMEHCRREHRQNEQGLLQRNLNDWFEQEVFAFLTDDAKQLLMRSAWLRHIPTSMVSHITDTADADHHLALLHLHHAFTREEHHPELGPGYVLHDLFRDFLVQRTASTMSPEQHYWQRRWGEALWQAGAWTEAAALLIDTEALESLAQGLREHAGILLQQGRGDQLFEWLQALPSRLIEDDPQLQVWLGLCLLLSDTRAARATLTSAWHKLLDNQDTLHMALAWSGIVDSIWLEWAHISEYDSWIDALLLVEDRLRHNLPAPLWFKVLRGMLTALGYARPGSNELKRWHREGLSAISDQTAPADERLMMASQLMYLSTWQFGRRADALAVVSIVNESPHLINEAGPLAQCLWATFDSLWSLLFETDKQACLEKAERGREVIRQHGISTWDNAIPPIHCALCFQDKDAMADWANWFMRTELKAHRPFYDTFQAHVLSGQAWLNGHLPEAIEHARRSLEAMHRHGSEAISAGFEAIYASLLSEAGRYLEALRCAARAKQAFRSFDSGFVDVMVYLTLARIPLHRGQPERALPFLRRALAAGARERLFFPIQIHNDELATLAAMALRDTIEPAYVKELIKTRALTPPTYSGLRLSWPWSCRLLVLGRFDVAYHDQPTGRVPQKRARALLSELVLAGRDGLPLDHMARSLWPDSDADKAANSLHVTTHRAREALGHAEALIVDAGLMKLNPHHVWVDCWELEALALQAGTLSTPELEQAIDLYRGPPHLEATDDSQLAILQENLNQHYLTLVQQLGERLESRDAKRAQHVYRQAQRHLPLEQTLWSGLLRTEAALGNARTLELTFEQARQLYRKELETDPPEGLVALFQQLTRQGTSGL